MSTVRAVQNTLCRRGPNHALQRTEAGGRLFLALHVFLRQPLSLSLSPLGPSICAFIYRFFIFCLGLFLAHASAAERPDWQSALEADLESPEGLVAVFVNRGHLYVTTSARVGRILDSHTKDELLPYLMGLRRALPPGSDRVASLQVWCAIVSSGERGTPADSVYHYVVP